MVASIQTLGSYAANWHPPKRSGFSVYGEQVVLWEEEVVLDAVEWIHAVGRQVPDGRQHVARYYG